MSLAHYCSRDRPSRPALVNIGGNEYQSEFVVEVLARCAYYCRRQGLLDVDFEYSPDSWTGDRASDLLVDLQRHLGLEARSR